MKKPKIIDVAVKKRKKERRKRRRRRIFYVLSVLCAFSIGALVGIHRNVIKALINGEPLPELPESHKRFCPCSKMK